MSATSRRSRRQRRSAFSCWVACGRLEEARSRSSTVVHVGSFIGGIGRFYGVVRLLDSRQEPWARKLYEHAEPLLRIPALRAAARRRACWPAGSSESERNVTRCILRSRLPLLLLLGPPAVIIKLFLICLTCGRQPSFARVSVSGNSCSRDPDFKRSDQRQRCDRQLAHRGLPRSMQRYGWNARQGLRCR